MQPIDGFLPATDALLQALAGRYRSALQAQVEAAPFEWGDLNAGQMAQAAEPAPLTVERIRARVPYMSKTAAQAQIDAAVERGALEPVDGGYALTPAGRAFIAVVSETAAASLRELDGRLPGAEPLVELLGRQVAAICAAPGIESPCISGSRSFDPGPSATAPERLRRYLIDLNSWRDDAHVAAWREHESEGHAWEAFSHVWAENTWGDPISTAAEAAEKLGPFRGYDEAGYQSALDRMTERGWLEAVEGRYQVTAAGRALRQAAEEATDRYYFAPMQLEPAEAESLREHLRQATEALQAEAD